MLRNSAKKGSPPSDARVPFHAGLAFAEAKEELINYLLFPHYE